jgi:hypothetical protein
MTYISSKDFSKGWIPSDDAANASKNGLLRMDNLVLDEVGILSLRKGIALINTLTDDSGGGGDVEPPVVDLPNPWAYYKFESVTSPIADLSGNSHNLVVTENYPLFPALQIDSGGVLGNCAWSQELNPDFDYSSWMEFTGGAETYPAETPFSFVFWWAGWNALTENNGGLEIYFPPAEAVIDFNSLTTSPFTAYIYMSVFWGAFEAEMELIGEAYNYESWHMYSITFDGTYVKFYIDKTLRWTSDAIDISGEDDLEWQDVLFTDGWSNGAGWLDESVIYKGTALTLAQIEYIYNDGNGRDLS